MNFWEDWPKPWTRDQCERRYVEGAKISLRKLSGLSGVPLSNLTRWSSTKDEEGKSWVGKRDQFEINLRSKTRKKTLEKVSNQLSEENSSVLTEHFTVQKTARELAGLFFQIQHKTIRDLEKHSSEEALKELSKIVISANFWSLILDRSIKGERTALGLEYEQNPDKAAQVLERLGLTVLDLNNDATTQSETES